MIFEVWVRVWDFQMMLKCSHSFSSETTKMFLRVLGIASGHLAALKCTHDVLYWYFFFIAEAQDSLNKVRRSGLK